MQEYSNFPTYPEGDAYDPIYAPPTPDDIQSCSNPALKDGRCIYCNRIIVEYGWQEEEGE